MLPYVYISSNFRISSSIDNIGIICFLLTSLIECVTSTFVKSLLVFRKAVPTIASLRDNLWLVPQGGDYLVIKE